MAHGKLHGADVGVNAISTDSRTIFSGELFVALEGENFDGHEFINEKMENIARAVFVHKPVTTCLPGVLVDDTLQGLSRWAQAWRNKVAPKLVAVTGSNGKTTVKQMLTSVLSQAGDTCSTQGNLNNHIGVPLTLLSLRHGDQYAVIEMGANHFGEIDHLSQLAQPDVAIITNAGPAHLEGFGSVAGVAEAKGEIFNGVNPSGIAVLNADDEFINVWREKTKHLQVITFGFSSNANVQGLIEKGDSFVINLGGETLGVNLPMPGKHNKSNALAVAAAAYKLGIDSKHIKQGLENALSAKGRLQSMVGAHGATIIDDTYNANPASLQSAIEVLCSQSKEPWLVLGDMGELGTNAEAIHEQIGRQAKSAGVKKLFCLGVLSKYAAESFGQYGYHFNCHDELSRALCQQVGPNCCILVKGSRAMHMEDVVNHLVNVEMVH